MNEEMKKLPGGKGENELFARLRMDRLSPAEKSEMRLFLRKKVSAKTGFAGAYEMLAAPFRPLSFRQAMSLSAIIAVVLASGGIGVAKASEQSLPGEALYKVKTVINEPILGLLKRTPEEKALWAKALSERRMEEANELSVSGKLGEKESREIEELIEKHHEYLERYEDEDDDDFANKLGLRSEKIELKIETRDGKKQYRIHEREERENRKEDDEREKEDRSASEEDRSFENEDEEDDDLIRKEEKKEDRKKTEKKESSEKKVELKKQGEAVKRSEPESDSGSKSEGDDKDEEEKIDSSGSGSGKDDGGDDDENKDSGNDEEGSGDSGEEGDN